MPDDMDVWAQLDAAPAGNSGDPTPAPAPEPPHPAPTPDVWAQFDAAPDHPPQADPTVGMRSAAIAAQDLAPAEAAKSSALATRAGVNPRAIQGVEKTAQANFASQTDHFYAIAARHPELASWLTEPVHAAIGRDDLAQLRDLSSKVQSLTYDPGTATQAIPITGEIKQGVNRAENTLRLSLLPGPAWLQQEARDLFGITSAPSPYTPLGMLYGAYDQNREMDRVRATYAPSAMRDLVGQIAGMAADPLTSIGAPAKGAELAVQATEVIGEQMLARQAIKGAAVVQGELAAVQSAQNADQRKAQGLQAAGTLAATANAMVQGALGFFAGKLGQEIPILRSMGVTPFTAAPLKDLGSDIVRNAVTGGTQSALAGTSESVFNEGRLPQGDELVALYASGAIPGALMAAGNAPEAMAAQHHFQVLKHAEALADGNKILAAIQSVQASKSATTSPEEVGKLVDAIAQQSPLAMRYLQSDEWTKHFEALGLDPLKEAEKAGLKDEYLKARALGSDMQLPLRAVIGMGVDSANPAELAGKFRIAPNAPNTAEAVAFFQAAPEELAKQKLFAQTQITAARGAEDVDGNTILEETRAQALAAGRPESEAQNLGELNQRFYKRLAQDFNAGREAAGLDPITATDLRDQFPINIRAHLPEVLEAVTKSGQLHAMLDELRTKGPENPENGTLTAMRTALKSLGLDAVVHSNEEIAAEMAKRAGDMSATAKQGLAEQTTLSLNQGERLNAPDDGSLHKDDLRDLWRRAHGEREPDEKSTEWHELVRAAKKVDAARGLKFTQGERGAFTTGTHAGGIIHVFANADPTTLIHEWAHYAVEVLARLGDRADAPPAIKAHLQTLLEFSGYGTRENMLKMQGELSALQREIGDRNPTDAERATLAELSKPHETLARGFEAYVMRGVAPSIGLRRAFARMKAWMTAAYRDMKNLGVTLQPEVTDVFDRLLASDREIQNARRRIGDDAAFKTQEESGFDDKRWASYQQLTADARQSETDGLAKRLLAVERKATSEAYANDRIVVHSAVSDEVGQQKVFRAIKELQDGETWDGRKLEHQTKLAKADVERLLTPDEIKQLPGRGRAKNRGRDVYTLAPTGDDPDKVAHRLGYETGHDLMQALIAAPDRETAIDALTDERMKAKYPDPMEHQGLMEEAANHELHASDLRGQAMEMEAQQLSALGDKSALKALTKRARGERDAMRVAAHEMIRTTKVAELTPEQYTVAERRNAIAYTEAFAKKDYAAALKAKRAQMMNAELARAAYEAEEQVGKQNRKLVKSAVDATYRQRVAKAGGLDWTVSFQDPTRAPVVFSEDNQGAKGPSAQEQARTLAINERGTYERTSRFVDQVDNLLERFGYKDANPATQRPRESLPVFLERIAHWTTPDGEVMPTGDHPVIAPSMLDAAGPEYRKARKDLTIEDLQDLHDSVQSIEQVALDRNKAYSEYGKVSLQERAEAVAQGVRANPPPSKPKAADGTTGRFDGLKRLLGNFNDSLRMVPVIAHEMDGRKTGGDVWEHMVRPAQESGDRELMMKNADRLKIEAAADEWGKRGDARMWSRQSIPGVDRKMSYLNRIVTLMHYGNKEGRQRLLDLNRWDDAIVHKIVDGLDAKDIAFANAMVDILGGHWSDIKAMEEKYNGVAPPKVEAIPVELPNGTYKGGYQRIYYDGESVTSLELMAQRAMEDGVTGGGFRPARTARGATIARQEKVSNRVLSLDPMNWSRALNESAHDLTHRDVVVNQLRLLKNEDVRSAIVDTWGAGVYQQFLHQTKGLAEGNKPAVTTAAQISEYLRVATNYSKRAFNPAYALIQEAGLIQARTRVGDKYLLNAQMQLLSGPLCIDKMAHWIQEQSTSMRFRPRTRDANIGDTLSETTLSGSTRKFMDGAGMFMVLKTWEHMDNVTWLGAYNQHMTEQGGDHATAVHVADQIVESLMGSAKQKDLAQIMRGDNQAAKIFTSNMNWSLANWNAIASAWRQSGGGLKALGSGGFRQMATGLGSLATLCIVGPMLWDWMYDEMHGNDMKEWTTGKGLAKKAWTSLPYSVMASLPILRDLEPSVVEGRHQDGGMTSLNWIKALQEVGASLHAKHYTAATAKAVTAGVATFLPLPSAALFQAMDGYQYADKHHADFIHRLWYMANGAPKKH